MGFLNYFQIALIVVITCVIVSKALYSWAATGVFPIVIGRGKGAWRVHVNGSEVPAALRTSVQRLRGHGGGAAGDGRVVAPMPGRVVKVLVAPGAAVEARQGLVVVEAMKMENELRAPRAGVVREVRVAEGASVEAQTVLVIIDEDRNRT